jgi:hypothetical protein
MLITESTAARVFEVTADGQVVWSWVSPRWKNDTVPEIYDGLRYDVEYVSFLSGLRKDEN